MSRLTIVFECDLIPFAIPKLRNVLLDGWHATLTIHSFSKSLESRLARVALLEPRGLAVCQIQSEELKRSVRAGIRTTAETRTCLEWYSFLYLSYRLAIPTFSLPTSGAPCSISARTLFISSSSLLAVCGCDALNQSANWR